MSPNLELPLTKSVPHSAPNKPADLTWPTEGTHRIACIDIRVDPRNRKEHDKAKLKELADSIKAEGLLQPIVVRRLTEAETEKYIKPVMLAYWPHYQVIAGERRFEAHRLLKRQHIQATVVKAESELQAVVKQTVENVSRVDLNPMDEARQMLRLSELKMPQKEIGKLFGGRSQPLVANTLRLLELPGPVQDLVSAGKLSQAHGVNLVRWAKWKKLCLRIAELAIGHDWDAKSLLGGLPFDGTLEQEGLAVRIRFDRGYDWETRPTYTIPKALQEDPDFAQIRGDWWYFKPDNPDAPDKWAPEQEKQDKARAAAEAARRLKAEKSLKAGKPNKEQRERREKLEHNKKARGALAKALDGMATRLKACKGIDAAALALVCRAAANSVTGYGFDPVKIFELGGLTRPAKFNHFEVSSWAKLKPVDQVKLAALTIANCKTAEASRYAGEVPTEVSFLGKGGKK